MSKPLKEITKKIASGATPRGGKESYKDFGISLIRSQNILDFDFDYNGLAFIDEDQAQKLKNVIVEKNDILLNITGDSVARCSIVPEQVLPARVNQHVMIIRVDDKQANYKYVFYYLQYIKRYLLQLASGGATRNALTKTMIENLEYNHRSIEEQEAIANILSSLDDKIENNNAIIANLEEQAQAIFKSWFVDFEPFQDEQFIKSDIGLIPKTGKVVSLDNIAEVIMGVSPKSETYNNNNIGLPLLNGAADFAENSLKPTRHTSDPKRISQQGDWILCIRGTIGNLAYSDGEYALGRGVAAIRPLEQSCQSIIYHYILLNIKQLKRNATGSVISGLSKTDLTKMKVFIPEKTKLNHISNVLLRILKYQIKLEAINETLSSIRDILLPKLMSGEIRVEETIEVEEM